MPRISNRSRNDYEIRVNVPEYLTNHSSDDLIRRIHDLGDSFIGTPDTNANRARMQADIDALTSEWLGRSAQDELIRYADEYIVRNHLTAHPLRWDFAEHPGMATFNSIPPSFLNVDPQMSSPADSTLYEVDDRSEEDFSLHLDAYEFHPQPMHLNVQWGRLEGRLWDGDTKTWDNEKHHSPARTMETE